MLIPYDIGEVGLNIYFLKLIFHLPFLSYSPRFLPNFVFPLPSFSVPHPLTSPPFSFPPPPSPLSPPPLLPGFGIRLFSQFHVLSAAVLCFILCKMLKIIPLENSLQA